MNFDSFIWIIWRLMNVIIRKFRKNSMNRNFKFVSLWFFSDKTICVFSKLFQCWRIVEFDFWCNLYQFLRIRNSLMMSSLMHLSMAKNKFAKTKFSKIFWFWFIFCLFFRFLNIFLHIGIFHFRLSHFRNCFLRFFEFTNIVFEIYEIGFLAAEFLKIFEFEIFLCFHEFHVIIRMRAFNVWKFQKFQLNRFCHNEL